MLIGALALAGVAGCDVADTAPDPLFERFAGARVIYDPVEGAAEGAALAEQSWNADGTTEFDSNSAFLGRSKGLWEIRHGQYCTFWGPVDHRPRDWTCWDVEFPEPGRVAFVAPSRVWVFLKRFEGRFVE